MFDCLFHQKQLNPGGKLKSMSKLLLLLAALIPLTSAHATPLAELVQGGYRQGQGQTITCSSDDGRRNYCNANGANLRDVTMTRQISGSACIQGQTWGVDNRGIWVDRGCRAEFTVGGGGGGYWGGGQGQTITCSSDDGRRNYCNGNGANLRNVTMTRQISGSACIQGQTWGVDNRGIWVDRGCRAEFMVGGGGGNWGGGQGQTITCSSDDGRRNYCSANGAYPRDVTLTRQISGSACIQNQTWGVDNRGIWVDRGCRAEFSIRR
jgi:Protein of unknown function (DUF3011)